MGQYLYNAMIWTVDDAARCHASDHGSARAALAYNESRGVISEWGDHLAPIYTVKIDAECEAAREHDAETWEIAVDSLSVLEDGGDPRETLSEWYALRLYRALSDLADTETGDDE